MHRPIRTTIFADRQSRTNSHYRFTVALSVLPVRPPLEGGARAKVEDGPLHTVSRRQQQPSFPPSCLHWEGYHTQERDHQDRVAVTAKEPVLLWRVLRALRGGSWWRIPKACGARGRRMRWLRPQACRSSAMASIESSAPPRRLCCVDWCISCATRQCVAAPPLL